MACRATPAAHRSGASLQATMQVAGVPSAWSQSFNSPSRDHADGATLGRRDAHASRRTRRPAPRDAIPRGPSLSAGTDRRAPDWQWALVDARCQAGAWRSHDGDPATRLKVGPAPRSLRTGGDSEGRRSATPLIVTLSGAASEAAQSKGPPMERRASLRETRFLTCGDLSTRSRTLSLKVTCRDDSEGGASPTLRRERPTTQSDTLPASPHPLSIQAS